MVRPVNKREANAKSNHESGRYIKSTRVGTPHEKRKWTGHEARGCIAWYKKVMARARRRFFKGLEE